MKKSATTTNYKTIHASPHDIYKALTSPEAIVKWQVPGDMTAKVHRFDLRVGGGYSMSLFYPSSDKKSKGKTKGKEDRFTARFIELVPDKKIVMGTVFDTKEAAFAGEMIMQVVLEKKNKNTKVTFTFKNIPKGIKPEDNKAGTRSSLDKLAQYAETKGKQQVLFAHSAGAQSRGKGSYGLVRNLKKELGKEFDVLDPIVEKPMAPEYAKWKKLFNEHLKKVSRPIILVGHSLGASALLKYLSEEKPAIDIEALLLVATPYWSKNHGLDEFVLEKNFANSLKHIKTIYLYQSKNDPVVPFTHLKFYKTAFPFATVHELRGSDHVFAKGLPQLAADILSLK